LILIFRPTKKQLWCWPNTCLSNHCSGWSNEEITANLEAMSAMLQLLHEHKLSCWN